LGRHAVAHQRTDINHHLQHHPQPHPTQPQRLYITTELSNPHYLPEVCIKVTLINFTVTMQGLEDQLLGEVVRHERLELEEARDRLVVSIAGDKRQLQVGGWLGGGSGCCGWVGGGWVGGWGVVLFSGWGRMEGWSGWGHGLGGDQGSTGCNRQLQPTLVLLPSIASV